MPQTVNYKKAQQAKPTIVPNNQLRSDPRDPRVLRVLGWELVAGLSGNGNCFSIEQHTYTVCTTYNGQRANKCVAHFL